MTLFPAGQNELEKVQCAEVEQKSNLILIIMFSLISSPETENRFRYLYSKTFTYTDSGSPLPQRPWNTGWRQGLFAFLAF